MWQNLNVEIFVIDVLLDNGECALDEGDRVEAQARLQAVERLVGWPGLRESYHFLRPRLEAYRARLENPPAGCGRLNRRGWER